MAGVTAAAFLVVMGSAAGWIGGGGVPRGDSTARAPAAHLFYANLTIRSNPANGFDQVSPANFSVPHGAVLVLTVTNYDTGVNPTTAMWQQVMGTVGGTESVAYGGSHDGSVTSYVPGSRLSHTLTILPVGASPNGSMMGGSWSNGSMMGGSWSNGSMMGVGALLGAAAPSAASYLGSGGMVNIPIPAALNDTTPAVVQAYLSLGAAGNYVWQCESPCDQHAMATAGYMRGTVTVA